MAKKDRLKWLADKLLREANKTKQELADEKKSADAFLLNLRRRKRFQEFRANKGKFVK